MINTRYGPFPCPQANLTKQTNTYVGCHKETFKRHAAFDDFVGRYVLVQYPTHKQRSLASSRSCWFKRDNDKLTPPVLQKEISGLLSVFFRARDAEIDVRFGKYGPSLPRDSSSAHAHLRQKGLNRDMALTGKQNNASYRLLRTEELDGHDLRNRQNTSA